MRVYMLPLTITATLMSAHMALADRAQQTTPHSAVQAQAEITASGKEQKTLPS